MNRIEYDKENKKITIHDIETNVYYQNNPEYFLKLKELVETDSSMHKKMRGKTCQELKDWINICVPFLHNDKYSYWTKAYFIFSGYTDFPICSVCGKNKIMNINVTTPSMGFRFSRGCSFKCRQTDPIRIKNIQETMLKRYGVKNINQNKEFRNRGTQTRKAKNNGKYFSGSTIQKIKQTCLRKYGVENYTQTDMFKKRAKQTFLKHYGVDNNMKCEIGRNELKSALLDKYGVDNAAKCPEIQDKIRTRYNYNGINFDTQPELAFYIWLKDNKIQFEYHHGYFFDYEFNGKSHRYFPDFKIGSIFYEIKGDHFFKDENPNNEMICPFRNTNWTDEQYLNECAKYEAKHQCMLKNNVKILTSFEYQQYLDYIDEKYGKNYLKQFKKLCK